MLELVAVGILVEGILGREGGRRAMVLVVV